MQIRNGLADFLREHIDSVTDLEVLLLLRSAPDKAFGAEVVAGALRIDPTWTANSLAGLQAHGLIVTEEDPVSYRYGPRTPELARCVDEIADLYRSSPVAVITEIVSKSLSKVRSFADSFRFKKKDE